MSHPSRSTPKLEQERPWLQAHYAAKRQRTVTLVKAAVDRLQQEGQKATIEAICRLSRELDPEGKGIQKAGVLGNAEAYAYYRQHSASYRVAQKRKRQRSSRNPLPRHPQPTRIDAERNIHQVRRRYLQVTKAELVERLLEVEQSFAQVQQQLARLQFAFVERQHEYMGSLQNPAHPATDK